MEKTSDLQIPAEFSAPPKKNRLDNLKRGRPKNENGQIDENRPRLTRINRTVKCIHCEEEKILNPDQYQSYFDFWGTEDKITRNFFCKSCDVAMQENPFAFWYPKSELTKKLLRNLKTAFESFRVSARSNEDEIAMTEMIVHFLKEAKIHVTPNLLSHSHLEFIIKDNVVVGLKIKNIPFVGSLTLLPYESEKIKISE
jgi:hypothetical protein